MEARDNPWATVFRWLIYGLAAVLVVELLLLLWTTFSGGNTGAGRNQNVDNGGLQIKLLPPLEDFSEAVDRTLFSWRRRPGQSQGKEAAMDGSTLASRWVLTGLVNTGKSTYAVFSELEGDGQVRLEEGMDIESWTVEAVDTEQIILVKEDKREIYRLSVTDVSPPQVDEPEQTSKEPQDASGETTVESKEPENEDDV